MGIKSYDNVEKNCRMRVVFDTNIYIAAILRGGFAEDIISLADKNAITLVK